jgi:hypothetical protein
MKLPENSPPAPGPEDSTMDATKDHGPPRPAPAVTPGPPIHLGGATLGKYRHVCALFHNRDEEYRALLPFIKEGFDHGDQSLHLLDPDLCHDHCQRLRGAGIDVEAGEDSGQLQLQVWEQAYLRDGRFDQERMLELMAALVERPAGGATVSRIVAHMEWALLDRPGSGDLVEYESRINTLLAGLPHVFVCVYDLTRFSGDIVVDIMRAHPVTIIGGVVRENPFFVPPEEFLPELRDRQARRSASPARRS